MTLRVLLLPFVLGCTAIDHAKAQSVIVPRFRFTQPEAWRIWGFHVTIPPHQLPMRVQMGYDVADFGVQSANLQSVGFRRSALYRWVNPAVTLKLEVDLSHGAVAPASFGRAFEANHGADKTRVFAGSVNWPSQPPAGRHVGVIPFSIPFPFDRAKGLSLVLDIRTMANNNSRGAWYYDQAVADGGGLIEKPNVERSCIHSYSFTHPWSLQPGGTWQVEWFVGQRNVLGIGSIGFVGRGGRWGNSTLPIDLTPLGAPGCKWGTASQIFFTFPFDAGGVGRMPAIPIPNVSSLIGSVFYEQSGAFVPNANPLGLITFPSYGYVIGSGRKPNVVTVSANKDIANSPIGWIDPNSAAFVEFRY